MMHVRTPGGARGGGGGSARGGCGDQRWWAQREEARREDEEEGDEKETHPLNFSQLVSFSLFTERSREVRKFFSGPHQTFDSKFEFE